MWTKIVFTSQHTGNMSLFFKNPWCSRYYSVIWESSIGWVWNKTL